MVVKDEEFIGKNDEQDLDDILENLKNKHKEFANCTFNKLKDKYYTDCTFKMCNFGDLGTSTFTNCVFDGCKFYSAFNQSKIFNCHITNHVGNLLERGEVK